MDRQKSFVDNRPKLYLVSTPIGNLGDITYRAVEILKSVKVCFAEDTRNTKTLFNHYDIKTPLLAYHEFNKEEEIYKVLGYLDNNDDIALVSDAGNPLISDPGFLAMRKVIERGYAVVPIPGPSASLTALTSSNISPTHFYFYGFLNNKPSKRRKELEVLKIFKDTLIFYEAPHRIKETLEDMLDIFGDRFICLAREMTKKFEEFIRGNISDILEVVDELKGEMVLVVSGNQDEIVLDSDPFTLIDDYIELGLTKNEAIKKAAKDLKIDKNILYKEYNNK